MARKTPTLDLQPETRQVVAQDLNLFYRPEAEPEIAGMKEFTASLDNFVNGAGTAMVINAEKKEKELSEAEALEAFNKNRLGFNSFY